MGKSTKETGNGTIMKEKKELIEGIVDGYRKLGYSEEKIEKVRADLLSDLQKEPGLEVERDELYGDKDKILENLKQKVVVEENVNYMGYKGKKVHITLPEVEGKFEGFKFEYFVSNGAVIKTDFEVNPELEKKSYSMKDVGGLLGAMNKYMQAMGVETDGDMDYENELNFWKTTQRSCDAGKCLKAITGLNNWYWLSDKNLKGRESWRGGWNCSRGSCTFMRLVDFNYANLFLKLS